MTLDLARAAACIREAAAEEMIPRFARLDPEEIADKGAGDLVTAVDLAMEQRLGRVLPELLPGSMVVGEEAVAADAGLLAKLGEERPVWVVDPLDGTGNFAAALPIFAVIVALVAGGRTLAGLIYDPLGDRMAMGEPGGGAWMDGRRLKVSPPDDLRRISGSVYGRRFRESDGYRALWGRGRGRLGQVFNARCVGQEYLARLQGGMQFGIYTRLNPWDHAAGCLLHEEAGGHVARFDGSPYVPTAATPGILVTPDRALWDELHRTVIAPVDGPPPG